MGNAQHTQMPQYTVILNSISRGAFLDEVKIWEPLIFVLMQWELNRWEYWKEMNFNQYLQHWLYEWSLVHLTGLLGEVKQVKPYIISVFLFLNLFFI